MSRHGRFCSLNIGICDLFVIWYLEFVILNTNLQGRAIISAPNAGQAFPIENTAMRDNVALYLGIGRGTGHNVQNSARTKIGNFVRAPNIGSPGKPHLLFVGNSLFTMGSYFFRCGV